MIKLAKILACISAFVMCYCPIHATAESNGTFSWNRDEWYIANSPVFFQGGFRQNIRSEHLEILQNNLNHIEYRLAEPIIEAPGFNGTCYGMAATSMLACYDILNPDEHIKEIGTERAALLHLNGDLFSLEDASIHSDTIPYEASLIHYYLALQATDAVRQKHTSRCDWTIQEKLHFALDYCTDQKPVMLGLFWTYADYQVGHAMLAIGVETGSWTWDERQYDRRILLYDSSTPYHRIDAAIKEQMYEENQLYLNTETGEFCIPGVACNTETCYALLINEDVRIVNSKGLLESNEPYTPDGWTDVITSNELKSEYTLTRTDGTTDGIKVCPVFYPDNDAKAERNFVCKGEENGYVLQTEQAQVLHGAAYYQNRMLMGDSDAGTKLTFDPSGKLAVSGEKAAYSLEMVTNENYPTQWYDVIISGTAANASLESAENGYVLKADDLHTVQITAKNLDDSQKKHYSTDADSILFFEKSEGVLAAAIDSDGNGSYETELAEQFTLGDVNEDGSINAKDATEVLIAAARIGTGQNTGLMDAQQKAADVDHNGKINAVDATWILQYAAAFGTGTAEKTLDAFIEKRVS